MQKGRELLLLLGAQGGQDCSFVPEEIGQRVVDSSASLVGQPYSHTSAIVGILVTFDESATGESIDAVGHRAAGDESLSQQLTRRECVRRPAPAQCGEDIELPQLQFVCVEGRPARAVEMAGQAGDARQDLQRGDIEIGSLATPSLDEPINLVRRPLPISHPISVRQLS